MAYLTPGKGPDSITGMMPPFQQALMAMFTAAPPEIRQGIHIFSGYRSPQHQAELFANAVRKYGSPTAARHWVAPPGRSQHNRGDAADLKFASPAVRAWVHANAAKYGLAFPMGHEPWHIELAGARGGPMAAPPGPGAGPGSEEYPGNRAPAVQAPILPTTPVDNALFAGLGGGGGGGIGVSGLPSRAEIDPSPPLFAAGEAAQNAAQARSLADRLLPAPESVSTSVDPMKLALSTGQGAAPLFGRPPQYRSRPGLAPLMGGIRLRA